MQVVGEPVGLNENIGVFVHFPRLSFDSRMWRQLLGDLAYIAWTSEFPVAATYYNL